MAFNLTSNDVRGPLRWWYNIGAPPDVSADAPLKMREQARIGKLISLALFIEIIEMGIAGFSTTEDPNKTLAFAYLGIVATLLLALVLNRFRKTGIAGVLVVGMIEVGMIITIFGIPHQQLDSFNLPLFELFIQPLLIAASIFPIWLVFPLALYHIAFTCLAITFMAKTPDLIEHIRLTPYTAYGIPITLQVITTLVSFVWVSSMRGEMRRAETAEEITRLTQELADHLAAAASRQEELERNIEVIRHTLATVAGGDYQQQVALTRQDILWPIALSLNTLLNRTHSFREQGMRFEMLNKYLYELAHELHLYRTGQRSLQLAQSNTGTALDLLVAELRAWSGMPTTPPLFQASPSSPPNYQATAQTLPRRPRPSDLKSS